MKTIIKKYEGKHISLVKKFNSRIKSKNTYIGSLFPESNIPFWQKKENNINIYQEYFLAFLDEVVRGGYMLKHQKFFINGKVFKIAQFGLPLSEGIIDSKYALMGIQLIFDAVNKSPDLFALGMGGMSEKLPKILKKMKWELCEIPFHFMVINPKNFFLNITYLRKNLFKKILFNIIAYSGLGNLIFNIFPKIFINKTLVSDCESKIFEKFDSKSDDLWKEVKKFYKLIALRDSKTLNSLYKSQRFIRMEIYENRIFIGWVVLLNTKMSNHRQFGNMRVGSIVDCLASPENALKVIKCGTDYLMKCKVDIIVANHSHKKWNKAFNGIGFIQGPSNYLFAAAPILAERLEPFEQNNSNLFLTRGDGDGPINL